MRSAEAILGELEVFGIRLGLESTATLLAAFGDPQRRYRVVLVAGTNGKGSTSSLLASILHAAGLRTALYTSPHLEDVTERIRVGGRVIDADVLARRLERVVEVGRETLGHPPTYFEAITVAAYWHLAEEKRRGRGDGGGARWPARRHQRRRPACSRSSPVSRSIT